MSVCVRLAGYVRYMQIRPQNRLQLPAGASAGILKYFAQNIYRRGANWDGIYCGYILYNMICNRAPDIGATSLDAPPCSIEWDHLSPCIDS